MSVGDVELDIVVLGAPRAAVAAACAAVCGGPEAGLVLVWPGPGVRVAWRVPPSARGRALAARLAARGVHGVASGALVRCVLPEDPAAAIATAKRAAATAAGPVAAVVCGPRVPGIEPLIAGAARVVLVADAAEPLARCAGVDRDDRVACAAPASRFAEALALAGLTGLRHAGRAGDGGQALPIVLAAIVMTIAGALALALLGAGLRERAEHQRAADLGALAGARALLDARPRALDPAASGARPAGTLTPAAYLALGRRIATQAALRNGAQRISVRFGGGALPDRVRVTVRDPIRLPGGRELAVVTVAEAELTPYPVAGAGGEYTGLLATRDGKPMRPDVALAYDRLARAARAGGHELVVVSGFRSSGEQARLWAAHPDPRWVARPGTSLHRLGTELDLGPASAYGWLAANAPRFGFLRRYSWEPWHYGLVDDPGSASLGYGASGVPAFVPVAFRDAIRAAAVRHRVGAALLAAQISQESGFHPRARSPAGALGIAQFMPGTAELYGLADPFDPATAIDAQARLMHDLLRRFGSVPLALAAYNAGPAPVAACGCVPAITETQVYVARILALLGAAPQGVAGPPVRLIR